MRRHMMAAVLAGGLALTAQGAAAQQEAPAADLSRQITVTILGMSCPFCVYGVEQKLKHLDGVANLEVVLKTGLATLTMADDADIANDVIIKAVTDAGFDVAMIDRNFPSPHPKFVRDQTDSSPHPDIMRRPSRLST